ncbi:DNA polymerase phi-domain-containing protein [Lentinula boryana]|uniref:DNA polymerase phi-domain-containing protein n=1 Tax=Lentinula boryana TaxID=40481 RepID=A0ABQ8PXG0_9AGAR|nr:DNA polymerase phi-domain-containing protein [Lentinula boryana]
MELNSVLAIMNGHDEKEGKGTRRTKISRMIMKKLKLALPTIRLASQTRLRPPGFHLQAYWRKFVVQDTSETSKPWISKRRILPDKYRQLFSNKRVRYLGGRRDVLGGKCRAEVVGDLAEHGVFSIDGQRELFVIRYFQDSRPPLALVSPTWASHPRSKEGAGDGDDGVGTSRTIVRFILGQPRKDWERRTQLEMEDFPGKTRRAIQETPVIVEPVPVPSPRQLNRPPSSETSHSTSPSSRMGDFPTRLSGWFSHTFFTSSTDLSLPALIAQSNSVSTGSTSSPRPELLPCFYRTNAQLLLLLPLGFVFLRLASDTYYSSWMLKVLDAMVIGRVIVDVGLGHDEGEKTKTGEWVESVLNWFVVNGLFVVKKKSERSRFIGLRQVPKPQLSDELRQACRDKLLSCLADLTSHVTTIEHEDNSKVKVAGAAADGELWVDKVLSSIEELKQDTKHLTSVMEVDEEEEALRLKVREVVAQLKKVSGEKQEAASGTQLLLLASLVQQSCSDEVVSLETIESCVEAAMREFALEKSKKKRGRPSIPAEDDDGLEPIDVIVDTIIGFMEKSTAYMRIVGNQVFSLISDQVKSSTIDLILTQLETRDPTTEESSNEEMDEDEEDEGEDNDNVVSDSSSDDSDEEEDNDDVEVDEELRQKILEALSVNGIDAANEDDGESDEEYMDDDQMMAIDEHLAEIFRSRVNEKKASKDVDAQREATHFKNRVLDLVDIFIKKQQSSSSIFRLIIPLMDLITRTTSDERQLSDKAQGIVRSRIGKLKEFSSSISIEDCLLCISKHLSSRNIYPIAPIVARLFC